MRSIKPITYLLVGLVVGAMIPAVLAWVDPTASPPGSNASAPLNVSSTTQTKIGGLNIATTSGKVGVGTASPLSKLDVNGGIAAGSYAGANSAPSNGLIVSGTVGFGTSSPDAASAFHIAGGTNSVLLETASGSGRGVYLKVLTNSGTTTCATTCGINACLVAFRDDTGAGLTCADATSVNKNCLCAANY